MVDRYSPFVKHPIILVIGPPRSGKSALCNNLDINRQNIYPENYLPPYSSMTSNYIQIYPNLKRKALVLDQSGPCYRYIDGRQYEWSLVQ